MSLDGVLIRPSREDDVEAIAAIYRHHVLHGIASFEEVPPEPDEIARRRRDDHRARAAPFGRGASRGAFLVIPMPHATARGRLSLHPRRHDLCRCGGGRARDRPSAPRQPPRALYRARLPTDGGGHRRAAITGRQFGCTERSASPRSASCARSGSNSADGSTSS